MYDIKTAEELADLLKLNPETIRRWTRDRKIPHLSCGPQGNPRYNVPDVLAALNRPAQADAPTSAVGHGTELGFLIGFAAALRNMGVCDPREAADLVLAAQESRA